MDSHGKGYGPSSERGIDGGDAGNVGQRDADEAAASERMRDAIAALASGNPGRDDLRAAACELVATLRSKQQAPEKALIQIKKVLADAGLETPHMGSADDGGEPASREAALYRDLIAWSIRCYYEAER